MCVIIWCKEKYRSVYQLKNQIIFNIQIFNFFLKIKKIASSVPIKHYILVLTNIKNKNLKLKSNLNQKFHILIKKIYLLAIIY